jgi:hypothetical protein
VPRHLAVARRLKRGDFRADGLRFNNYIKRRGREDENWLTPEAYLRTRVNMTFQSARVRAAKKKLPFNITTDFLLSILPDDGLCPALRTPMVWGGDADNSPSLDRVVPNLGYVIGNVEFISNRANRIKTNATTDEIVSVATYLKGKN